MKEKVLECIVKEGLLRKKLLELAESKGISKASIKFGRFKIFIEAEEK